VYSSPEPATTTGPRTGDRRWPPHTVVALLLGVVLVGAILFRIVQHDSVGAAATQREAGAVAAPKAAAPSEAAVKTDLPGIVAPTGEPTLGTLADTHPAPGRVAHARGPFDDRFTLSRLSLDRRHVGGVLTITSDVSDLLELQVLAGFYDRHGRLLGTGRFVHHATGHAHAHVGTPSLKEPFTVPVPERLRGEVHAAAVGVPVLVNE